ncbi:MAG: FAD-binding oxidoreductase [Polyangiaceae bacterium]|nr:FAD-binding oxidoreductase [Polyangiaceae bacterium]
MKKRKIWGWGYESEGPDPRALAFAEASLSGLFGGSPGARRTPPSSDAIELPPPRIELPASLAPIADTSPDQRLVHALGRSYRDLARAVRGVFPNPPDVVAFPASEEDVARLMDYASSTGVALVPFGGGTSVCGGVEPDVGPAYRGTISVDMGRMSGVVELDRTSLAANVRAGTLGPDLESALRPHGLTLRHFPQSFEMSTVGGWIATRAGGHFATLYTHIDDLVESVRVVTPAGQLATRRLPGSGAGPAPDRLFIGSEGALGIITSAWVRLFARPLHRATATVRYSSFDRGIEALRRIVQSGLHPSNCRLLDGAEALMSGAGAGDASLLLLAFESAEHPQDVLLRRAVGVARDAGGVVDEADLKSSFDPSGGRDATADTYKASFFRAPYLRDELVLRNVFVETYETAVVWSGFEALDAAVSKAVESLSLGPHLLARRITHAYRDGCAPYFTLITKAREGDEDAMWVDIKKALTDAIESAGGTCTHHHAVGRDVVPWYQAETPELFRAALAAAKSALDPHGIMNPGTLLPARGTG